MPEEFATYGAQEAVSSPPPDISMHVRDLEEKLQLLKDRLLLVGKSVVEEREKNMRELQAIKSTLIPLKEEVRRMRELLQRMAEQLAQTARKEELAILQRQLDLLRQQKGVWDINKE